MTKIIFIHKGQSWFLPYVLNQAELYAPGDVVLLADNAHKNVLCTIEKLHNIESEYIDSFKKVYFHMSTNNHAHEEFCWVRWFYLLEYMKKTQMSSVLYFDSDVLIYSSIIDMLSTYSLHDYDCGFCIPEQEYSEMKWVASGHISYWSIKGLERFCKFILESFQEPEQMKQYKEKWKWHKINHEPGGICDMTTLYLFWYNKRAKIANLLEINQNKTVDDNVNVPGNLYDNEYEFSKNHKKIRITQGIFFIKRTIDEKLIQFLAIHFQGSGKKLIPRYYTGNIKLPNKAPIELRKLLITYSKKLVQRLL